jgi:hypothetical protein
MELFKVLKNMFMLTLILATSTWTKRFARVAQLVIETAGASGQGSPNG